MPEYRISAGSKLSYATITDGTVGTYVDLVGCTQIPEIGQAPDTVDSTTLDDLVYMTSVPGLINLGNLDFPFNLEHPAATANINVVAGLDKDTIYSWKVTYASGVEVVFKARPRYSFNAVGVNELEAFTLHLSPEDGLTITVPTASV